MNIKNIYAQLARGPTSLKVIVAALVFSWLVICGLLVAGLFFFTMERAGQALEATPAPSTPVVTVEPAEAPVGALVTIQGEGWPANNRVLIYLIPFGDPDLPDFALADAVTDPDGRFSVSFIFPAGPEWEIHDLATVLARTNDGQLTARALFRIEPEQVQPEETVLPLMPTVTPIPTETPTPLPAATPTPLPPPTETPAPPALTATTNLNIRSGPGTGYSIIGLLRAGQSAEVTGLSFDRGWWQIEFSGVPAERGWVSAWYVTTENVSNVPLVQAPSAPAAPAPTPVVITEWRGEYFDNPNLSGAPALVRNDSQINFDWGNGSPAPGLPADNFSVRWSRSLHFPAGTYRFFARVDDGVRLWVNDQLIIDRWHDSPPTTYTADIALAEGSHHVRMEYYERRGEALAQLSWQRLETYATFFPDWKGEYFDNPNLSGAPVLVRNDREINFNWGPSSPGPGVPADNFSVRWTRNQHFSAGLYRFRVLVDDGARLWIDDKLVIDRWRTGPPTAYTADVTLTRGEHHLRLEYFEHIYDAQVRLTWERIDSFPDWKAEYFDNRHLRGDPVRVRNESRIDHDWGRGSPGGVPSDNFSARWTRTVDFEGGLYLLQVRVDDGVRVWVGDTLVIDDWRDGSARLIEAEHRLSGGRHRVRVEYYERTGDALIQVNWRRLEEPPPPPPLSPQAVLGGPFTVDEGSQITLDGRASSAAGSANIVSYEWDFNYNGQTFNVNATGPVVTTSYPDGPATAIVALRVTDNRGASHLAATQVTVRNVAPTANAGGPYTGQVGSPITLSGSGTDPSPVDQAALTYRWDFGDGTTAAGAQVSHTYQQAGSYNATLTVTDKDGAVGTATTTVEVSAVNRPPAAVINGPESGLVGATLSFSAGGSSDLDGHIVSYAWDFGDGATASGVEVTHSYAAAGQYEVSLTVTDNGGLTAGATWSVQIVADTGEDEDEEIDVDEDTDDNAT